MCSQERMVPKYFGSMGLANSKLGSSLAMLET